MRLKDHVNASVAAFARRRQRGANLGRMVPVVVHHRDAVRLPALLKPPVDSAKMLESLGNLFSGALSS